MFRTLSVLFNKQKASSSSETKNISAGVPQDSGLGPLLWVLYINDLIENLESEALLFADDTCLFASARDPTQTAEILNRDPVNLT